MKNKSYISELHDELIKRIPEYVSIDEAARMAHVSKSKLKADFLKAYKMSFYSYFRMERMKYAAKILVETDEKIIDIAEIAGYDNSSKFSKAFRDVMDCTPSEYRRNNAGIFAEIKRRKLKDKDK